MANRKRTLGRRLTVVRTKLPIAVILSSLATLLVVIGAGCSTPVEAKSEADIYATVVRQLYTVDHGFGEPPNFPIIYLVEATTMEWATRMPPRPSQMCY